MNGFLTAELMKMVALLADRAAVQHGHIGLAIPVAAWPIYNSKSNPRETCKSEFIFPASVL